MRSFPEMLTDLRAFSAARRAFFVRRENRRRFARDWRPSPHDDVRAHLRVWARARGLGHAEITFLLLVLRAYRRLAKEDPLD